MTLTASKHSSLDAQLPEGWTKRPLGELGAFSNGINKPKEAFGSGHPFINLMDVFGIPEISSTDECGLVVSTDGEKSRYGVSRGDVLFVRSSVKPSGVGLTTVVTHDLSEAVFSGFLLRFRNREGLDEAFKRYCFHAEYFRSALIANSTVSANTNINQGALKRLPLVYPTSLTEQNRIATALKDIDDLIASLDALIAKKRDIKQAAMQQLLTGKTRLPGFEGEWESRPLGDVLWVRHGKDQKSVQRADGRFPILATGGEIGRTDTPLYSKPSVLIGRKGTIDRPQYMDQPFWTVDTLFYSEIQGENSPLFLFYVFQTIDWRSFNEASGVPSLSSKTIEGIVVNLPEPEEQAAIALTLADFDHEIEALEQRAAKSRSLKDGMMQQLLTGRIRLI